MTAVLPTSNTTAAQLVDSSLLLARRRFFPLIRAALPALFVAALLELLARLALDPLFKTLAEFVGLMAIWGVGEAMAIAACLNHLHGRPDSPADCWAMVRPRLGSILVGYCWKWLMIIGGFSLLIVPGLYIIALYFAVPTTMVAERRSLIAAFRRSRALARPGMKRIVGTLGIFEVMVLAFSVTISFYFTGEYSEEPTPLGFLLEWCFAFAILPFRASLMTLLYLERRVRREGYDLELALAET